MRNLGEEVGLRRNGRWRWRGGRSSRRGCAGLAQIGQVHEKDRVDVLGQVVASSYGTHPLLTSTLATATIGEEVRICCVRAAGRDTQRLRELGLLEGKTVWIVSNSHHLICQVGNCRFGLCRRLAHHVLVEPAKIGPCQPAKSA